jgi:hypothetical protein
MKEFSLPNINSTKTLFLLVCIIVTTIVFEATFTRVLYYSGIFISERFGVILFSLSVAACIFSQALIFNSIKSLFTRNEIDSYLGLKWLGKIAKLVWYCLSFLLISIAVQMFLETKYTALFIIMETGLSYGLGAILLFLIGTKLLTWFRSKKGNHLLIFAISVSLLAINLVITYVYVFNIMIAPLEINAGDVVYHQGKSSSYSSYNPILQSLFGIFTVLSFVSMWISTTIFMRHYSKRIGKIKYWVLVCLPLVYFLGQFQPLIVDLFEAYRMAFPVTFGIVYTLFFSMSQPGGGILFGIAFWSLARSFKNSQEMRNLLYASGLGLLIFFSANQMIIIMNYLYPPFGAASISFLPLASYLLLLGIYGSALVSAHDANIRRLIRKSVLDQAKLLESMGSALKQEEIYNKVMAATTTYQRNFRNQEGIGSSLSEDEVKKYLEEVIQEVKLGSDINKKMK